MKKMCGIWLILKNYFIKALLLLLAFLTPIQWLILIVGVMTSLDTIAGRWRYARKAKELGIHKRELVKSKITREGFVSKNIGYLGSLILLYIIDSLLITPLILFYFPLFPIMFAATTLLAVIFLLIEADSIDEKYYAVTGKSIKEAIKKKIKQLRKNLIGAKQYKKDIEDLINRNE